MDEDEDGASISATGGAVEDEDEMAAIDWTQTPMRRAREPICRWTARSRASKNPKRPDQGSGMPDAVRGQGSFKWQKFHTQPKPSESRKFQWFY